MTTTTLPHAGPTEAQLEQNRVFAKALGVLPSTLRGNNNNINLGWAHPSDSISELNEFGNELNTTVYPDLMILQARNKMDTVLKVERKWKAFLADVPSMPLNRMDRPTRAMVHEYLDYWKLRTKVLVETRYVTFIASSCMTREHLICSCRMQSATGEGLALVTIPCSKRLAKVPVARDPLHYLPFACRCLSNRVLTPRQQPPCQRLPECRYGELRIVHVGRCCCKRRILLCGLGHQTGTCKSTCYLWNKHCRRW